MLHGDTVILYAFDGSLKCVEVHERGGTIYVVRRVNIMSRRTTLITTVILGTILVVSLAYHLAPAKEDDKDE